MQRPVRIVRGGLGSALILCTMAALAGEPFWTLETLEGTGEVLVAPSLALGPDGNVHAAYFDQDRRWLMYARRGADGWSHEVVEMLGGSGVLHGCSIAVDRQDRPHIAYRHFGYNTLKYAHWNGTNWRVETVDDAWEPGFYPSIALDAQDRPHISYQIDQLNQLGYAHWNGTSWVRQSLQDAGWLYTSLRLDSQDRPWIAAQASYDLDRGELILSHWNGSAWSRWVVDDDGHPGSWCSLALDDQDHPRIAYVHDVGFWELEPRFAWYDGASWTVETLLVGSVYAESLALGPDGDPWIGCRNALAREFWLVHRRGVDWVIHRVDSADDPGGGLDLTISPYGELHALYRELQGNRLRHARGFIGQDVTLILQDDELLPGDPFRLERVSTNRLDEPLELSEGIVLDVLGELYFWPDWRREVQLRPLVLPAAGADHQVVLDFTWPAGAGSLAGLRFWAGLFHPAGDLIAYHRVDWGFSEP